MSFYQTNNSSIVRFNVRDPARLVVAPFATLQRVVRIENIGAGTGAHYTGANPWQSSATGTFNNSFFLTPEQIDNGSLIVAPAAGSNSWTLPAPYALQEYLGGRGAFNMAANLVDVTSGANPMTGLNDYFLLNVYNLAAQTGLLYAYDGGSDVKVISAAPAANDASMTPVLIQFERVNSPYATINGVANTVTYNVY
jgi:hypothetical protein